MVPKHPKNPFFFETTKRQISAKILSIRAILTRSCDKIIHFYKISRRKHEKNPFTLSLSRFCSTLKTTAFTQAWAIKSVKPLKW